MTKVCYEPTKSGIVVLHITRNGERTICKKLADPVPKDAKREIYCEKCWGGYTK